ncbi:hypothetical protein Tco_1220578 [Tanacetum coccineum]
MIITESSIRSDLHLEDAEGTDCLPTTTIFEELAKMGSFNTGNSRQPNPKAKRKCSLHDLGKQSRLERQKKEEANIALIESWENTQAMMEAGRLLAERLQTREREELTDEEKGKLFMELHGETDRKHFAT